MTQFATKLKSKCFFVDMDIWLRKKVRTIILITYLNESRLDQFKSSFFKQVGYTMTIDFLHTLTQTEVNSDIIFYSKDEVMKVNLS